MAAGRRRARLSLADAEDNSFGGAACDTGGTDSLN
jgi:hypothetical protein